MDHPQEDRFDTRQFISALQPDGFRVHGFRQLANLYLWVVAVKALPAPEVCRIGASFYGKSALRVDDIQLAGVSADDVALETVLQFVITDFSGIPEFLQGTDKFVTGLIFYLYVYV
jgi:hypothetical protein